MSLFKWSPWATSNPSNTFNYVPIDVSQRTFRLIRLLPPKPSLIPGTSGTLRIEIIETDVGSPIPYDALSYVWDVPPHIKKPNRRIIVETKDGRRELLIYRSLEMALLHLAANNITHRPLFIDQISINQKNKPEKNHQVGLMREIYAKCVQVIVWLGPPTRSSEQYFNFVDEICCEGVLGRVMGPRVGQFIHVFDAVMDSSLEVNEEQREDRDDLLDTIRRFGHRFPLDGYADVLDRTWFNRLWTIQEACLAPAVVFVCGNQSLCFDCFRAGSLFYNIYNTHWIRGRTEYTSQSEYRKRSAIFEKTAGFIRIFQERKAIHQSQRRQGLLPHDRIFGLLGLTAPDDHLRQRVNVDYEKDVIEVYAEVAALLMEENVDTLLFSQLPKMTVSSQEEGSKLPSWAPDWAMNLTTPIGYSSLKEPVFAAGGPKDGRRLQFDKGSQRLTVRGVLIDKILQIGNRTLQAQSEPQITEQIDYRSAKLFFDEVTELVRQGAGTRNEGELSAADEAVESRRALRLCDSGLSYKHFVENLGDPAGIERLGALQNAIAELGQRLIRSDEIVASYHITRIYQTIGITPWYFLPFSQTDAYRRCAIDPVSAGKIIYQGLSDFIEDVVGLCVASARVYFAAFHIKFRRRFSKVNVRVSQERGEQVGLDPNVSFGPDMSAFIGNLLRNKGRKLYRTGTGFLGVGPVQMKEGDSVAVFHGGTVPHLLRPMEDGNDEIWEYLGEVYCDGIMEGEALQAGIGVEQDFVLC
ncbi:Heterokaryon incompatibility 6-like protein [Cladobotryum mycophilum]|uniref:Heterokaryon incompatibility 6-like protein n=1 Tax=Cladobotryum mycophilum TaxID=491253 RepID=A0ABR0S8B1_9HYPO